MNFSIPDILYEAFGFFPQVLQVPKEEKRISNQFSGSQLGYELENDVTYIGTPWVDSIYLAKSTDYAGNVFPGIQLPATTMIDVTRRKTIVETAISGRDGTVKELISAKDYAIRFRGLLINEKSLDPPYIQIHEMKEMFLFKGAIYVESALLRALAIDAVVVLDFSIKPIVGTSHAVVFELTAISENSQEFIITNGL